MDNQHDGAAERERRLQEALVAYLEAVEAGRAPEPDELLARYPEFADELAEFLANRDQIDRLAAPLRRAVEIAQQTIANDAPTLAPGATLPPQVGTNLRYFGEYELLEEIARGGMGVVFRARQTTLKRIVALKMILSGQLAGEEEVKRFYAEAEAAAKLDHPNIVPIFEIGQHEGQHYFSMSFIEGESLAHKVADGPMASREAAELVRKIALAIGYAHAEGVIHRDLKPGNVLLDRDGEPRITDFGLAKRVEGDSGLTATGQVVGTPSYMPPEQARGELDRVGPLADVYAAGGVLYCLLTARPPFQAANPLDTLLQVLEKDPVPVRDLVPQVPRDLETICLKCLEKEPRRRYGSACELAEDLKRFLNGEPVKARPISRPARLWRWCRRNPAVSSLLAVAALLLLSVAVASGLGYVRVRRERNNANHQLYLSHVHLAHHAWQAAEITRVQQLLDQHGPQSGTQDLRGWEWYYLKSLCRKDLLTLPYRGNSVAGHSRVVAWSPDGRKLAIASWGELAAGTFGGTVEVRDASTGKELYSLRGDRGEMNNAVAWSPDGRRLAAASGSFGQPGTVRIWEAATGHEEFVLPTHAAAALCVAWSPDGKRLASGSAGKESSIQLWDTASGQETLTLDKHQGGVNALAWSPDGHQLASAGADGLIIMWDLAQGKEASVLRGHSQQVVSVAWSPDGQHLASAGWDGTVKTWDMAGSTPVLTMDGHSEAVESVDWSPDSQRLASASRDRTVKIWDVATGEEIVTLRGHTSWVLSVAWRGDGRRLASASSDGKIKIWNATSAQQCVRLRGHNGQVASIAWSPDSSRLASASYDRTVKVWDVAAGKALLTLQGHKGFVTAVAWSPVGDRLASASWDGTTRVWDVGAGQTNPLVMAHPDGVNAVAWSPDGQRLATGSRDGTVRLWNPATGQPVRTLYGDTGPLQYERIGLKVRAQDDPSWKRILSLAWSPDGRLLAAGSRNGTVRVWDPGTGSEICTLRGHESLAFSVAWSRDSRKLAVGSSDGYDQTGKAIVWNIISRKRMFTLRGHTRPVQAVAWSPDGQRLVTGSDDKSIRVWDLAARQEALVLRDNIKGGIRAVAWSPDGQKLAAASDDGAVMLWDASVAYADDKKTR